MIPAGILAKVSMLATNQKALIFLELTKKSRLFGRIIL